MGPPYARVRLAHGRLRLPLACANLLVVEDGDDLAGLDAIALSHADLPDPSGRLGGDRGIIALDAAARHDHAGRHGRRREHDTPDGEAAEAERQHGHDREAPAARAHAPRLALGRLAASPWLTRSWMCFT